MEGLQGTLSRPETVDESRGKRDRYQVAETLERAKQSVDLSERAFADVWDIPRSSLRNWRQRASVRGDLHAFMESPVGIEFIHRLVAAAHLVFSEVGPCGTRLISRFLELSKLDEFVASSYGSQYQYRVELEEALGEYGAEEQARLASLMEPQEITVCQDETFHPQICLVAIEPLSNFILLEHYAPDRTSETWTACMNAAMDDLPVTIVQSTSDEGRSLVKHCRTGLGAQHSPDLFHVEQDVTRALGHKVKSAVSAAAKNLHRVEQETERLRQEAEAIGHSHQTFFQRQIQLSQEEEVEAKKPLEVAKEEQQHVQQEIRGLSEDYHPFDLKTGAARDADQVERLLDDRFDSLEKLAMKHGLSKNGMELLAKARKNIGKMAATVVFFWQMYEAKLATLNLTPAVQGSLKPLLAAIYLSYASQRAAAADERKRLRELSDMLQRRVRAGPFGDLPENKQEAIEEVVIECAGLFQRSSSCVEGRNGYLALHHHGVRRLSDRKLKCLTVVHNFFQQRADGSTAAERFFGERPRDMFDWLLNRLSFPPRPRKRK